MRCLLLFLLACGNKGVTDTDPLTDGDADTDTDTDTDTDADADTDTTSSTSDYSVVIDYEHSALFEQLQYPLGIGIDVGLLSHTAVPLDVLQDPDVRVYLMFDYDMVGYQFDVAFGWATMTINNNGWPQGTGCYLDLIRDVWNQGSLVTVTALDVTDPANPYELPAAPLNGGGAVPANVLQGVNLFDITDVTLMSNDCNAGSLKEEMQLSWYGGEVTYQHELLDSVVRDIRLVVGHENP